MPKNKNKSELTARWWQDFLGNKKAPSGTYFVKAIMILPNRKEVNQTYDTIQRDNAIVVPINNWISLVKQDQDSLWNRINMKRVAKERMASVAQVSLKIDDQELRPSRVMSLFFNINIDETNIVQLKQLQLGKAEVGEYKALSDGYWLFLEPNVLKTGDHKIETFGCCATGVFTLAMQHHLIIA